jgi:hypothetical protein
MSLNELLQKRFDELTEDAKKIAESAKTEPGAYGGVYRSVNGELFLKWTVKAKDLISRICGATSIHYLEFIEAEKTKMMDSSHDKFKRLKMVFEAAKEDFQSGYLVSTRSLIQAEVFDTELEQAKEFLKLNYKVPSAVISGTVLESALRDLCTRNNIAHGKLERMNEDLVKAGVYNPNKKKRITALAGIRNSAAHGHPDEFELGDVSAMIEEVERFLSEFLA